MTFLSDLTRHIRRVVEESKKQVHLDKITVAGGQVSKKAAALAVNTVQTRDVGAGVTAKTDITAQQTIKLIDAYLEDRQWQQVSKLAADLLFDDPGCVEALWGRLLASHRCRSDRELMTKLANFRDADFAVIDKILTCGSREFAGSLLELLYGTEKELADSTYDRVLRTVLPYSFSRRQKCIDAAFRNVIEHGKYSSFQRLLSTLEPHEVDRYISCNLRFARATDKADPRNSCLQAILKVDEGNADALRELLFSDLKAGKSCAVLIPRLETLLKYTPDGDKEVRDLLDRLTDDLPNANACEFAKQLIRYHSGEIAGLKDRLVKLSYGMLKKRHFSHAKYFLDLVLSLDPNDADAYWGICLTRVGAASEDEILQQDILLQDVPEFNRYLILVSDVRRKACISLASRQSSLSARRIREKTVKKLTDEKKQLETKKQALQDEAGRLPVKRPANIFLPLSIFFMVMTVLLLLLQGGEITGDPVEFQILLLEVAAGIFTLLLGLWYNSKIPSRKQVSANIRRISFIKEEVHALERKIRKLDDELRKLR